MKNTAKFVPGILRNFPDFVLYTAINFSREARDRLGNNCLSAIVEVVVC